MMGNIPMVLKESVNDTSELVKGNLQYDLNYITIFGISPAKNPLPNVKYSRPQG